jgi:hypothetical protein
LNITRHVEKRWQSVTSKTIQKDVCIPLFSKPTTKPTERRDKYANSKNGDASIAFGDRRRHLLPLHDGVFINNLYDEVFIYDLYD